MVNLPKKLSYEFVKSKFKERGYILLSLEYKGNSEKMDYLCNKHGKQSISYNHLSQSKGCPCCAREDVAEKQRLPFNVVEKVFNNAGYILLETKYTNSATPMKFICPIHGEQKITYATIKNGGRCFKCAHDSIAESHKLTFDIVNRKFNECGYKLLSTEYINSKEYLRYLCPRHGEQEITYNRLQQGERCSQCSTSKGEQKIQQWLDNNNITFATQYTFSNLIYKDKLRFDFCVFNSDRITIKFLIEYQGQQHYKPVDFAGKGQEWAEELFEENQIRDKLKADYCKLNNIPLLVIRYDEFSFLEDILDNKLKE